MKQNLTIKLIIKIYMQTISGSSSVITSCTYECKVKFYKFLQKIAFYRDSVKKRKTKIKKKQKKIKRNWKHKLDIE